MAILLTTLGWIGGLLGGGLLLLLIAPIHVDGRGVLSSQAIAAYFRLRWAFGVLAVKGNTVQGAHLYILGIRTARLRGRDEKDKEKQPSKAKKERKKASTSGRVRWFRAHSQTLKEVLAQLFGTLHLRGGIQGSIGLGDPSHTVFLDLLRRYLGPSEGRLEIDIWPDYMEEDIDLTFHGRAWIVCLQLLSLPLLWLLRRDTRQMLLRFPRATKVTS